VRWRIEATSGYRLHVSNQEPEAGIDDEVLPEDLRPTDDNPLAGPLTDDGEDPTSLEELEKLDMHGGKTPEQDEPEQAEPQSDD
jgi:hypothetical protein